MKISFIVNPIFINNGWSPWDTRIGGSEESVVEWAKRLNSRGHEVTVYHNGKHGDHYGVMYLGHAEFKPGDITINVNYPQFPTPEPAIYVTSLTDNPNLDQFAAVCVLSEYARDNTNVVHSNINILPLGYNPNVIYPVNKISKQCFYASSPDRGLDILLDAWPSVYEAHPDATLIVTYGGQIDLPGVINLGEVDTDTMNDIYRTSDIWCHPCTGGELYCITGKKAQAAGCIPVIIPTMALAETVARGFKVLDPSDYAQTLIEVLDMPMQHRDMIRQNVTDNAYTPSWDESTDILLDIIQKVLH